MYTTDDRGILNAYAKEPQVYWAEYPTPNTQRAYALQAAFATLLVATLLLVGVAVS